MNKKSIRLLIKVVNTLHALLVLVGTFGLFLLFYAPTQVFYSYFFPIVVGIQILFLANCPVTSFEDKLIEKTGSSSESNFFINRMVKKIFGFELPEIVIKVVLVVYFVLSVYFLFYA